MEVLQKITADTAEQYKEVLADYYYRNTKDCSGLNNFTLDDAKGKIDSLISHLKDDRAICYGFFSGESLVGYVWAYILSFREEQRVYISEIRIHEEFRGRGLGTQLLRAIEGAARELGVHVIYLHAEADNKSAIKLYESENYQIERIQLRKQID